MPFRAVSDGFQLNKNDNQQLVSSLFTTFPNFHITWSIVPGITLVLAPSPPAEHGTLHLVGSVQPQTLADHAVAGAK